MLNPILLAKCLAVGWVPIFWSFYQSSGHATIAPVGIEAKPHISDKEVSSDVRGQWFAVPPSPGKARSLTPDFSARRSENTPTLSPNLPPSGSSVLTSLGEDEVPAVKLATQESPRSTKPTAKEKSPKGITPLLEEFFQDSAAATDQPAGLPPDQPFLSGPDKPTNPQYSPTEALPSAPRDPELGVIEVADPRLDPELGLVQLRNPLQDPELGILELRQFFPPPPPRPFLYISTYVSAANSDNVFLVEDPVQGRFGDNYIRPGVSVSVFPALGPKTNFFASVETNFLRYEEQSGSNYDEIRFRAAVRHRFTDRVYAQLGFSSQLLFDEGYSDQFFTNNGIEFSLNRRDALTPQLTLDTFYQAQVFFSDPSEFSNVLNSVGAYLGYRFAPQWDTGIGYRLTISDFTRQSRHETYQRITGQLRYAITPTVRVSLFGGLSYGRSSEARITFDDSFVGISFDATIQVF